jgi:hypothetical protein
MSEELTALLDQPSDSEFTEDDFIAAAVYDARQLPDENKQWFPPEYVGALVGQRGGGKTLRLAFHSLTALSEGMTVFTNLELYPEKAGIKEKPHPLDLETLLSFDTSLQGALIVISELDTWIEKMRPMSTSSILMGKFLRQLRKRNLIVLFDTQGEMPSVVLPQVDIIYYSHDFFFTEWGRENNVAKGTDFYYVALDWSGIFTGRKGTWWRECLPHANKLWNLFNTNQIFDPFQFARKITIRGGEMEFNLDSCRIYEPGERDLEMQQEQIRKFNLTLAKEYRAWGNDFIQFATKNKAIIEDQADRYILSVSKIQKEIAKLKGEDRKDVQNWYKNLRKLIRVSNGRLAAFDDAHSVIALAKHMAEDET